MTLPNKENLKKKTKKKTKDPEEHSDTVEASQGEAAQLYRNSKKRKNPHACLEKSSYGIPSTLFPFK